jgi:hypothetical protein
VDAVPFGTIPVLGIGIGGSNFFDEKSLSLGASNCWAQSTGTASVTVLDGDHDIFNMPNDLGVNTGETLALYYADIYTIEANLGASPAPVAVFAPGVDAVHYRLAFEDRRAFLWGGSGDTTYMIQNGLDVFENTVRFLAPPLEITGTLDWHPNVLTPPTPTHTARIRGWSDNGGEAEGEGEMGGAYRLLIPPGNDTWHVSAVYDDEDGGTKYESVESAVAISNKIDEEGVDLLLDDAGPLPQPFIVSFDGTQMQTIVMPDGTQLVIPAGALLVLPPSNSTVTLFIWPTNGLQPDEYDCRIAPAYEFAAADANGQEITAFPAAVTLTYEIPAQPWGALDNVTYDVLRPVFYSTRDGDHVTPASVDIDDQADTIEYELLYF